MKMKHYRDYILLPFCLESVFIFQETNQKIIPALLHLFWSLVYFQSVNDDGCQSGTCFEYLNQITKKTDKLQNSI